MFGFSVDSEFKSLEVEVHVHILGQNKTFSEAIGLGFAELCGQGERETGNVCNLGLGKTSRCKR